jgi:uncharacterized protein YuzE
MKISYDKEADAVYIQLNEEKPEGVIELSEGINVDVSPDDKIVGIEILNSSRKIDLETIFSYELELEKNIQ